MRISAIALAALVGLSGFMFGNAEAEASCRNGIGVSRTVSLNTNGGARYGSSHGGHRNFLRDREVVLTFDDGPVAGKTDKVLAALARHCTKATFFMVGRMAANSPGLVKKIVARGHTVGVHSYSHRDLGRTNANAAIDDVAKSMRVINKAAGRQTARFFRFPYLSENASVNRYLAGQNYGVFAIDVDSLDYRISSTNAFVNRIMSELGKRGRGIILMHDIQNVTAKGLDQLLDRLDSAGYKVVHMRGGGRAPKSDPLLVASNSRSKSSGKSFEVASLGGKAAASRKKRNSLLKRPVVRTASKSAQNNVKLRKTETRLSRSQKRNEKKSVSAAQRKFAARMKKQRTIFAARVKKNQAAFRSKIKSRFIIQ